MHIKVYSTASCQYCHKLKDYLEQNNIEFENAPVDEDQELAQEMVALSGQMGVPFSVVTTDTNEQYGVLGFNKEAIDELFNLN
ncbi:NrdH-redoxin [candidate division WWE3 bacterium]|uniref:NrdH-redoxin n=1 Tax=candidate division WWE3 bacterium TaxID=2053526 RepID=A0A955RQD4_UNCKA|nr:NrdH-redoxin [candidate division WWE3 bacterium]